MDWNNNNLACANTWAFLRGLGELKSKFSAAGALRMQQLRFWNLAASPSMRTQEARALASRLDKIFVKALFAKYEVGVTMAGAVSAMAQKLEAANSSILDLAAVVDEKYRFKGELT